MGGGAEKGKLLIDSWKQEERMQCWCEGGGVGGRGEKSKDGVWYFFLRWP